MRLQIGNPNEPKDRTIRQPRAWRCIRCPSNGGKGVDFYSDYPECPRCGQVDLPHVRLLALIHILVPDPTGKIKGRLGRYRLGCHTRRAYTATNTNQEAATNRPAHVNCPECVAFLQKHNLWPTNLRPFEREQILCHS